MRAGGLRQLRLHGGAIVLAAIAASTPTATPAAAQGGGEQGKLDLVALAPAAVAFPTPGLDDFDAGWVDHPGVAVTIQSRPPSAAWELRIRADAPTLGGYGKPVTDILWRTEGSAVWVPLEQVDQPVVQGQGDQDVTLYFRLRLDWSADAPDTYSGAITFSALRP